MSQLSLDFATRQRDRGIALAEQGAINARENWPELALAYLRLYATQHSERFTAEDVLESADDWGLVKPPDSRAWGQTFRKAARLGIIVKDGSGICRKRHLSVCVAWKSLICLRALVADQCPLPKDRLELARAHHAHTGAA